MDPLGETDPAGQNLTGAARRRNGTRDEHKHLTKYMKSKYVCISSRNISLRSL